MLHFHLVTLEFLVEETRRWNEYKGNLQKENILSSTDDWLKTSTFSWSQYQMASMII